MAELARLAGGLRELIELRGLLADAQDGTVRDDLCERLVADEVAARHFDAFSGSTKRTILEWIATAKRPETRQRRIARTVQCAARHVRP